MRANPNWRSAQPGVMVYMPATRVSVEDTQQSLSQLSVSDGAQAQESQINDTVLPSCESDSETEVKTEPVDSDDYVLSRDSSPDTLANNDDDEIFAEAISTALSTPESSASVDLLTQLMAAAERGCSVPLTDAASQSPSLSEDYVHIGYESDRTDYLEATPSPSIRMNQQERASATRRVSQHFQRKTRLLSKKPLARRLDFGTKVQKRPAKAVKRSANAQALEDLRNLDRAPSHRWDNDEKELLCILNRWYRADDRATELTTFAKVFNSITGLNLRPYVVRNYFENHLRLYGGEAFREYGRVFTIPFDDPEGRYKQIRSHIEAEARELGLNLYRRLSDSNIPSGMAKYAKSPVTRDIYEGLVLRASQDEHLEATRLTDRPYTTSISMAVQLPTEDEWEIITDAEVSSEPVRDSLEVVKLASARPHLVFRVWDATNRTKFIDNSFIAEAFLDWRQPYPVPVALDDPSEMGKLLTKLHLSKRGDTPVYISTASSLLQALSYATSMHSPQIGLIDLDAASLKAEHKIHHAADVFPWLKSHGLALWARYRGHGEYFAWADIPSDAVLNTFDLGQLIGVLNNDEGCRQLLSFDAFESGAKTKTIAASLRERNLTLNTTTARALGKVARHFGMAESNVNLEHLQDFIARIMDGWTIQQPAAIDIHTMSTLVVAFATALGTHAGGFTLQEVMAAFMDGVDQGSRCIAHWSRSRSGSRRQRFREA